MENSRLANVGLPIAKVLMKSVHGQSLLCSLGSHEQEDWLHYFVCQLLVETSHFLPQIVHHPLFRYCSIGSFTRAERHEAFIIPLSFVERHVFKLICLVRIDVCDIIKVWLTVNKKQDGEEFTR